MRLRLIDPTGRVVGVFNPSDGGATRWCLRCYGGPLPPEHDVGAATMGDVCDICGWPLVGRIKDPLRWAKPPIAARAKK